MRNHSLEVDLEAYAEVLDLSFVYEAHFLMMVESPFAVVAYVHAVRGERAHRLEQEEKQKESGVEYVENWADFGTVDASEALGSGGKGEIPYYHHHRHRHRHPFFH